MRSSDVWLGLPYDFFTFSQLTNSLSHYLDFPVGSMTMNFGSSHLYVSDEPKAKKVIAEDNSDFLSSPEFMNSPKSILHKFQIKRLLLGINVETLTSPYKDYGESLSKNKGHCLEVLRRLSANGKSDL
jgi:hypothetical protein